jgi:thioredoxin reductase
MELDVVIIGAGPGGVQLGLTLGEIKRRTRAEFSYRIVEKESQPGSFFSRFPVHGRLISNNKLYSGRSPESRFSERFDWNSLITEDREILARNYSRDFYPHRDVITQMLRDLCERYRVPVDYEVDVTNLRREPDGGFLVETDSGEVRARFAVVATGLKPAVSTIPGIEHATPYDTIKPAEHYRDKRVLIIGKGNSGFECAKDILNEAAAIMIASPSPVRLAYQTHYVGNVRSVNGILIENYQLKHNAAILDCDITSIERVTDSYRVDVAYKHAHGERETLEFDAVIAATGFTGNFDFLDEAIKPVKLHDKFPDVDGVFQSRDIDGLYFCGALTHGHDYRSFSSSGFIHGFRYNALILARHLAERLGAVEARARISPDEFAGQLLQEFEEDAGIYLQPGYVGRCYLRSGNGTWTDMGYRTRRWFEAEPVSGVTLLLATLEYGDVHSSPDVLRILRHPGDPDKSVHIHPVIRARGSGGFEEVHLEESLLNRFAGIPANHQRLENFVAAYGDAPSPSAVRTAE